MLRFVVILFLVIIAITLLRAVIGVMAKSLNTIVNPPPGGPGPARGKSSVPLSGELAKDPVCGTYVSTSTSIKKTAGGKTLHFCSESCRDKHGRA